MSNASDSAKELALIAARAADDKQGLDITVLDVSSVLAITEVFVITSASNSRQVKTIASEVTDKVRETLGRSPLHSEGAGEQQWVLLDYGDRILSFDAEAAQVWGCLRVRDPPSRDRPADRLDRPAA